MKRSSRRLAVLAGAAFALASVVPAQALLVGVGAGGAVVVDPVELETTLDVVNDELAFLGEGLYDGIVGLNGEVVQPDLALAFLGTNGLLEQLFPGNSGLEDVVAALSLPVGALDAGSILPDVINTAGLCGTVNVASCNLGGDVLDADVLAVLNDIANGNLLNGALDGDILDGDILDGALDGDVLDADVLAAVIAILGGDIIGGGDGGDGDASCEANFSILSCNDVNVLSRITSIL